MGERLKVVTYKYRENLTLDFIQPLNNDSSVLCMYRIQFLLQSDEINSVVYMLYLWSREVELESESLCRSVEVIKIGLMGNA